MALNDVKEITIPECVSPYRQLEYIHFNGAESVHTAYNPYNGMRWELTFKMDSATEGYSGATGSSAVYHCTIGSSVNGYVGGWFLGAYRDYSAYPSTNKNTVILDRYQGKVWINDTLVYTGTGQYGSTTSYGMDFGARIDNSGTLGFYMKGNIYNSKISNEGTLIAEYIPAQRKSDSVCGLYRASNNTFYPMTGTTITDAAAGPTINENPDWDKPTVKKIEDANGNIIWGSQSAFPYRRLEYIKFSGTEYILTNDKPTNNRYYYLNYSLGSIVNDKFIFAANGDVNASTGAFRVTVRTSTTNAQARYGRNSSTNTNIGAVSTNVIYQNRLRIFNNFSAYFATYDTSTSSIIGNTSPSITTFTPANMYPFAIMGYNNSGTIGNMTVGKVYRYFYRIGDASGALGADCIPAQRKSDGVCGLYDTVNNVFLPMQGTNITTSAAGPLIDEYWDLTV